MKISTIDRQALTLLRPRIQDALRQLGEELGLELVPTSGKYGGATGQLTLEIRTRAEDGTVVTREAESFKRWAESFGLRAGDLGRTFSSGGDRYRITGLNPGAPRRPVHAVNVFSKKTFVFPVDVVRNALRAEDAQEAAS